MLTLLLATLGGADAYAWATLLLVPVTGIVSWFAARKVRNNSTLQQLQQTIDMLVMKNKELYERITQQNQQIEELNAQLTEVRRENAELITGQARISKENAELKRQIASLTKDSKTKNNHGNQT